MKLIDWRDLSKNYKGLWVALDEKEKKVANAEKEISNAESGKFPDDEKFKWICDMISEATGQIFSPNGRFAIEAIESFMEYPPGQIEAVIRRGAENGKKATEIISWMRTGLNRFDELYNGQPAIDRIDRMDVLRKIADKEEILAQLKEIKPTLKNFPDSSHPQWGTPERYKEDSIRNLQSDIEWLQSKIIEVNYEIL